MLEIRKTKINKRRSLPGLLPVRPSQLAGPASRRPSPSPSSVVFVLDRGRGVCPARARATAPRHQLACLPAPPLLVWMAWNDATPSPVLSHSPSVLPSSPSLSLSHGRTPPSPPFPIAAVTGHPSLPRLAQRLRLAPLFLPTAHRASGSPASPPTSPFPSSATGDRRRRIGSYRTSPSPLSIPAAPR